MDELVNIAFIIQIYPNFGGTERVTEILAAALLKQGHQVHILSWKQGHAEAVAAFPPERVHTMPDPSSMNSDANNQWIGEFTETHSIDILMNQGPFWQGNMPEGGRRGRIVSVLHYAPGFKLAHSRCQINRIYEERRGKSMDYRARATVRHLLPGLFARLDFIRHERPLLRQTMENSHAFVVLCPEYIREIQALLGRRLPCPLLAIPNPPTFPPLSRVPEKENLLLFSGRLSRWDKRPDRLIRIWSMLCHEFPGHSLAFAGDGPERVPLEQLARSLGAERVRFLGFTDLGPWYRRAQAVCITSDTEGWPMVIDEARAGAAVPFAFDVSPGIRAQISHGRNGFLLPPPSGKDETAALREYARALANFLRSPERMAAMQKSCLETVESRSSTHITTPWLSLFTDLLQHHEA